MIFLQAKSKYDRIRKNATEEADTLLLGAMKAALKVRTESSAQSERILSLKDGWHIVMEVDKGELTGQELMGFKGEIAGFNDNGKVIGEGGKHLESSPTVLKINFEYTINVNVDAIIYDQAWIVPRLFDLLALEGRRKLRENVLVLMRALTEDVKESRLAFGQYAGGLELLSHIFDIPGLDSCYVEICKLLALLSLEPENRMPVCNSPLFDHLKSLRRWKGSDVATIAANSIMKLERHKERVRKAEKQAKKETRQLEAVNRHKKVTPISSPGHSPPRTGSPGAPRTGSPGPMRSAESSSPLVSSRVNHSVEEKNNFSRKTPEKRSPNTAARKDIKVLKGAKIGENDISIIESTLPVFEVTASNTADEDDATETYADPDYV